MKNLTYREDMEAFRKKENEKLKQKAKKADFSSTLWLAKVKDFFDKYNQNLGYIRGKDKPPRKHRPAIVACRKNEDYIVFFLSKKGRYGYTFNIDKNCKYKYYCLEDFNWAEESRIFIDQETYRIKFLRLKKEDLDELMHFCSTCSSAEINKIAKRQCSKKV